MQKLPKQGEQQKQAANANSTTTPQQSTNQQSKQTEKQVIQQKKKEKSIEEEIFEKEIQAVEKRELERVFKKKLCGIGVNQKANQNETTNDFAEKQQQSQQQNSKNDPNLEEKVQPSFGYKQIAQVLIELLEKSEPENPNKYKTHEMKHEIDLIAKNMIWEVDENLDEQVDEYEFELMFKRCRYDKTGLEPRSLFNLVEFLMFDKENKGVITEEDTLELLYVKCKQYENSKNTDLNSEIQFLFGTDIDKKQNFTGEEKSINWKEYVEKVNKRAIQERQDEDKKAKNKYNNLKEKQQGEEDEQ